MAPVRVLIVDDSTVVRRVLTGALTDDSDIVVAGTAINGRVALDMIDGLLPDVVVLDIEMPVMDGITTLREIRRRWRWLPVIMFSTLTERGATATFDALAGGAADYVTKPSNTGSMEGAVERIMNELAPKVKQLARRFASQHPDRLHYVEAAVAPQMIAEPTVAPDRPVARSRPPAPARAPAAPAAAKVPTKPAGAGGRAAVASSSARKIEAMSPRQPIRLAAPRKQGRVEAVVMGVSTGGPNALAELLPLLPSGFPVPILIVQHMPPIFTRMLAERLDRLCLLPVVEATAGLSVRPGHVYLAPGDLHLSLKRAAGAVATEVNSDPPENSCRPSVDVLFRSAADVYGGNVLAVVLTGMGQDGLAGATILHEQGASVLVQDEESSVVWGMPGYVARAGIAEAALPLARIATEMIRRTQGATLGATRSVGGRNL
ncbi:MAG: Chemotaxis response regulator protein-glutamate methylesterase [Acidimicrobiia bacterium]|nr:Chemotaxis response regulator protein-glutamate methylesterase [Acidimicrobiia bacterium]